MNINLRLCRALMLTALSAYAVIVFSFAAIIIPAIKADTSPIEGSDADVAAAGFLVILFLFSIFAAAVLVMFWRIRNNGVVGSLVVCGIFTGLLSLFLLAPATSWRTLGPGLRTADVFLFVCLALGMLSSVLLFITAKFLRTLRNSTSSFFSTLPSGVLAVFTWIIATIVMFVVGSAFEHYDRVSTIAYLLNAVIIAAGCFFIIRANPKSIWYVPFICNISSILSAVREPDFWRSPVWIPVCSGWVLSIIASLVAVRINNNNTKLMEKTK